MSSRLTVITFIRTFCTHPKNAFAEAATTIQIPKQAHCNGTKINTSVPVRPDLDFNFLLAENNLEQNELNIKRRKSSGDIRKLHATWTEIKQYPPFGSKMPSDPTQIRALWDQALILPNISDPEAPIGSESNARLVSYFGGEKREAEWMHPAEKLVEKWGVLRWPSNTGAGEKSYALIGTLADLERVLLDYAFDFIYNRLHHEQGVRAIELLQVDDILPVLTTRSCGVLQRSGQHPIQYRIVHSNELYETKEMDHDNEFGTVKLDFSDREDAHCLSGTAEMGIAHRIKGRLFDEKQLPTYFLSESTCFRPEVTKGSLEGGLYRVHEFKKIEMFVVCTEKQSSAELQRLVNIQRDLLTSLWFHCRILDMPTEELGAPAARKFDIEAWLPGRKAWGELTSASNCTDYQARRLHIRYRTSQQNLSYVHTCNGTGIAASRALIALLESCQQQRKGLDLPPIIKQRMPQERSSVFRCSVNASQHSQ